MRRSDERIKRDIVDEFREDPVDASRVAVTVENGGVSLSGEVPTYRDGIEARATALRIVGVTEVIDTLTVNYDTSPHALPNSTT